VFDLIGDVALAAQAGKDPSKISAALTTIQSDLTKLSNDIPQLEAAIESGANEIVDYFNSQTPAYQQVARPLITSIVTKMFVDEAKIEGAIASLQAAANSIQIDLQNLQNAKASGNIGAGILAGLSLASDVSSAQSKVPAAVGDLFVGLIDASNYIQIGDDLAASMATITATAQTVSNCCNGTTTGP
jgi:hypothetical protein